MQHALSSDVSRSPAGTSAPALIRAVSLGAARSLTGWSERTLWRRLADGSLQRLAPTHTARPGRVLLCWDRLAPHSLLPLSGADLDLLFQADGNDRDAQADLAVMLMQQRQPAAAAYWLQLAAANGQADAMHWLGRSYLQGWGLPADRNLGLMWLARSASTGHLISTAMLDAMCSVWHGRFAATAAGRGFVLPRVESGA